ncbi:endonuclease VII domain-containing protein [Catenuloplanes atrovinosus]|uniref:Recombination endonuclease VII n=1 Tax=Catenuloplanes atrovinosus TaxID=137266 RepID=A0AAE3YIN9_9ACTN|nr:endonuclease VII domain-containing protein [Catenuloplanes atrovinosus]MDR7274568.1 hypothetical protein [Catenuloplanes atrovinosus]
MSPKAARIPGGHRHCPDCDGVVPPEDFPRDKRGRAGYGSYRKPCHNARGRESRERLHGGSRECHLRRRYGIGQDGVCAICDAPDPEHVDHDHRTGAVRGILCFNCNGGLGQFRDNIAYLDRAITYLKGHTWQRVLIHPGVYQMRSPTWGPPPSPSS